MEKKKLSALPWPLATDRHRQLIKTVPGLSGIATASRQEVDGKDTLTVSFLKPHGDTAVPWFRIFCQEKDYITQDLSGISPKWRTASIEKIVGWHWNGSRMENSRLALLSVGDGDVITGFMKERKERTHSGRPDTDLSFDDSIQAYQESIRAGKLDKRHKKILDRIDSRMALFRDIPKDYPQFVEDRVFRDHNYLFYSRKGGWAYCTRCRKEYPLAKAGAANGGALPRHSQMYRCPGCGMELPAKSSGMGRGRLFEICWSVLVQASGGEVLVRYFRHTRSYRLDFRDPSETSRELYRTVHTADLSQDYEWEWYAHTGQMRWRYPINHWYGWTASKFRVPGSAEIYNKDFGLLSTTCMRYSCMDIFMKKIYTSLRKPSPWIVDAYLDYYRAHPYIEQMLKIGWYGLVKELCMAETRLGDSGNFHRGRTILDTCGITRDQFLILKEATGNNPSVRDFQILKYAYGHRIRLKAPDLAKLRRIGDSGQVNAYRNYVNAMRYTTLDRLLKYFKKQDISHPEDYFDYLGWLAELGYDRKDRGNLYPKDFQRKHDALSAEYMESKNKAYREELEQFNRMLKEMRAAAKEDSPMQIQAGGLFIRPPYRIEELKKEGESLHHCVGTYMDRVLKGETAVFFIRKTDRPDRPYFTLEWKDHKVKQCRGMHNCGMTKEVKAFTSLFEEKMREYEQQKEHKEERKAA